MLGLKGVFAVSVKGFEQHPGWFARWIQRMKDAPGVCAFEASPLQDWECSGSVFNQEKGFCQLCYILP